MVNLMFGADAPKLTRLLIAELQYETNFQERPIKMEITDLAYEEQMRRDAVERVQRAAREKEETKKAKKVLDRKMEECTHILEHVPNTGAILVFPHARDKYHDALADLMSEASLAIQHIEKVLRHARLELVKGRLRECRNLQSPILFLNFPWIQIWGI